MAVMMVMMANQHERRGGHRDDGAQGRDGKCPAIRGAPEQGDRESPYPNRLHRTLPHAPDDPADARLFKRRGPEACSRSAYSGNGGVSPAGNGTWNTLSVFPISV
jgi:hypothetical protein